MALEQLALALIAASALLRFLIAPALTRSIDKVRTEADVSRVAWRSLIAFVANACLWAAVSAVAVLAAQYLVNRLDGTTVEAVVAARGTVLAIKGWLDWINDQLATATTIVLGLGLAFWSYRRVKATGDGVLRDAYSREVDRLLAEKARDQWEELPPTEAMLEIERRLEPALALLAQSASRGDEPPEVQLGTEERERLEAKVADLSKLWHLLDLQRRVSVELDPMAVGLGRPRGGLGRLGTLFVSEGLINTLAGASRVAAIGLGLIFVPSMLSVAADAPLSQVVAQQERELANRLHELRLRLALDGLEREFEQTLAAVARKQQAGREREAEEEDASGSGAATDAGLTADNLRAVRVLAHVFEARVFPESIAGRTQQAVETAASDLQAIRRVRTRHGVLEVAARFTADSAPVRIDGLVSEASPEAEALRLLERSRPDAAPVTHIGAHAERRFAELARSQPAFFRRVRHMADEYVRSFGRAAAPQQLRGLMVSQVIGHAIDAAGDLQEPWLKLAGNALGSVSGDAATSLLEAQYHKFVVEIAKAPDLHAAIEAAARHRVPIFHPQEWALFRSAADELPDQRRIVEAIAHRPPSISRLPEAHVNVTAAHDTVASLAQRVHAGAPPASFADALASFDDFFPGVEGAESRTARSEAQRRAGFATAGGPGATAGRTVSARNFARARSYVQLRGFARVGGVLLGRMPEDEGTLLPIDDIAWSIEGDRLRLTLTPADAPPQMLGPFPGALVHLALAYAADGRPTTVTMVRADPLEELRILLHPALVDTGLGCRAIRLDQFADEFTNMDEALGELRRNQTLSAIAEMMLYRVAWATRAGALLDDEASPARRSLPSELEAFVREHAATTFGDEELLRLAETALAADNPVAHLERKPAFFDARLIEDLKACTGGNVQGLKGLIDCIDRQAIQRADAYARDDRALWVAPPPEYDVWSGVRERAYILDAGFDFARADDGEDALWPLEFIVQIAFTSPAWFAASDLPWYDAANDVVEAYVDTDPWELDAVGAALATAIDKAVAAEPASEHAEILRDLRQFVILQRIFRLAFEGRFGESFPLEKLAELAQVTGPMLPPPARTLRWNPRPGQLEYDFLSSLLGYAAEQHGGAIPSEDAAAIQMCTTWLQALAEQGQLALASASSEQWAQSCGLNLQSPELSPIAERAEEVALIRRLRFDLGVQADDEMAVNLQDNACPAAY